MLGNIKRHLLLGYGTYVFKLLIINEIEIHIRKLHDICTI